MQKRFTHAILTACSLFFAHALSAQSLSYAGSVWVAQQTCTGTKSWHYQCLTPPPIWKPFDETVDTDVIATCTTPASPTLCANTAGNRRWRVKTAITANMAVRVCGVEVVNNSCPQIFYLIAGQASPGDTSGAGQTTLPPTGPRFRNVTTTAVSSVETVDTNFWAGLPDLNNDGCPDPLVWPHDDRALSVALLVQIKDANGCTGQFTNEPISATNAPQDGLPRIASRLMVGNWYDHPEGLLSFFGHDVDGGAPAAYHAAASATVGSVPVFDAKVQGCPGSRVFCLPVSMFSDGALQLATRERDYVEPKLGTLYDINTLQLVLAPAAAVDYANGHVALDVDADGVPEILVPALNGYLKLVGTDLQWQGNKFVGDLPVPLAAGNHWAPLDFDADGDMDLWAGYGTYSSGSDLVEHALKGTNTFYPLLYRNNGDGTFSDVTAAAELTGVLQNTYYHTTYANTTAADFDLDGFPDLLFCAESRGHGSTATRVTLLMNDGDGTFTVNRNNDFGPFVSSDNAGGRPWCNTGDYDADGLVDIVKTQGRSSDNHNSLGLWHNETDVGSHKWLRVKVAGAGANKQGLGASIIVRHATTSAIISSTQIGAFSTGSQNLWAHIGVADHAQVDVDVVMPNGLPGCHFDEVDTNKSLLISAACVLTEE